MSGGYLIDTHVWLWWNGAPEQLSAEAREVIANGKNDVVFSVTSGWEIAIKHGIGKLRLPNNPERYVPERLAANRMRVLPVALSHALRVAALPHHHRDPFDRLLISQAQQEGLILITADEAFSPYDVSLLRT